MNNIEESIAPLKPLYQTENSTSADRKARARKRKQELLAREPSTVPPTIYRASCRQMMELIEPDSIDFIYSDPPYPQEYLYCFRDLAELAVKVLKPGAGLLVMSGSMYLPQVYQQLDVPGLNYNWELVYLMGGLRPQILIRKVMGSGKKPLLHYTKGRHQRPGIYSDVIQSPEYSKKDRSVHHWAQMQGGTDAIINKFCYPGDIVLDPFLGGGSTGIAAVRLGCQFIGSDIDVNTISNAVYRIDLEWRKKQNIPIPELNPLYKNRGRQPLAT